jgi:hypothetical protein
MLAAIRPDNVNIALLLHVLGAMLLVGTLVVVAASLLSAWRRDDPVAEAALTRLGLKALLIGVVPSWVIMRIGGQWTESEENLPEAVEESTWLGIGYLTADLGVILILISVVLAVIGLRRLREPGRGAVLGPIVGVVSVLLLAAYVVAVWAMTTKPD